jgi:molecular chaperone DnaK
MVKEAEINAAEDKKRRELVEARNHAEAMIHSAEKSLKDYGDKVSASDRGVIEAAITDLKSAVGGESVDTIKAKTDALAQAAMKLGEAMYKDQQAGGDAGGGAKDDDVMDADFEEVDDDKKKSA